MNRAIRDQESFDAWLLRKNRLEHGIDLLNRIEVEHGEDISQIFLASVAIDCSIKNSTNAQSEKYSKRMKRALKDWLSKNYSFRNVTLSETEQEMVKNLCILSPDDILPICSYHNSTDNNDSMQKSINQIYINEFNRRWSEARNILHRKCVVDLESATAEPKNTLYQERCIAKVSNDCKEYKAMRKDSKACSNLIESKSKNDLRSNQAAVLTPDFYRVSLQRFQAYLSFGVRIMEGAVDRSERKKLEKRRQEERCKTLEKKKICEDLMLKSSCRKKIESSQHLKSLPQVTQSYLNVGQGEEKVNTRTFNALTILIYFASMFTSYFKKKSYEIIIRPSVPKIWVEDDEGSSRNNIILKWESEDRDVSHFVLSSGGFSWTDRSKEQNSFELRRKFCLKQGYEYKFGAKVALLNGQESEEATIRVTTSPPIPKAPALIRSTDCSLELKWKIEENEECTEKETIKCELIDGLRLHRKYIIQLNERGEWIDSSIGSTKYTGSVIGLRPDTSYQVRVKSRVDGHPDVEGQDVFLCTKQRLPSKPEVVNPELSASSVSLTWKIPRYGIEDISCDKVRKLFNEYITESKSFMNANEFDEMLTTLGSKSVQDLSLNRDVAFGEKLYLEDVITKWRTYIITILFMQRIEVDGSSTPWVEVYRGDGNKVKISNLLADTEYAYKICHLTLRSKSGCSDIVTARTLPSCPGALKRIAADSTHLDLKVDKPSRSKCVLLMKEASPNQDNKTSWNTVYQGKSDLVHIPFLRSKTKYHLKCYLLNKEGHKGRSSINAFTTSETPICFNDNTIPGFFQISTSADNLVVGDLILLNETLNEDSIYFESGLFEHTWITRVVSTGETFDMDIVFDLLESRNNGKRIQRNIHQMNEYEIMRMKWIDELIRR